MAAGCRDLGLNGAPRLALGGRAHRSERSPGIDLLQRDYVGVISGDRLRHPRQIETAIGADAAMNVPRHHANDSAAPVQMPRLLKRRSKACAPIDTASQASTARMKSNMLIAVGSLMTLQIW